MSTDPTTPTTAEPPICECCGEPATRQDRDGVWLCEDDYRHLIDHSLIEEAANG